MALPPGWVLEAEGEFGDTLVGSLDVVEGQPNGALFIADPVPGFAESQGYGVFAFTISGAGGGGEPCEPRTARDVFPNNAPQAVLAGGQDKFVALEWLANDDGTLWLNDDGTESLPA